jgi:hypothetical protein
MKLIRIVQLFVSCFCAPLSLRAANSPQIITPGFATNREVFPIAVWLQSPNNAQRFKASGINLYVGLWRGPTEDQLEKLKGAEMAVICSQNAAGLANKDNPLIVGWMHGDEPDNAQSLPSGKGYGPPIKPEVIQTNYARMHQADPTRPVLLNLGQGVAWDNYIGRGVRRNHPEDYPEYVKGCDIASFDIYPVVHDNKEIAGKLEYVARGVRRLRAWSEGRVVWNCIECTHISNTNALATPDQIRAEVWMSIIHGSRGLIYFVHQFKPTFKEAALLDQPEILAAVTRINAEVQSLAPVIHAANGSVQSASFSEEAPLATLYSELNGTNYIFAACMRNASTPATFSAPGPRRATVEVIGEQRSVKIDDGLLHDKFGPYAVHLYRWKPLD